MAAKPTEETAPEVAPDAADAAPESAAELASAQELEYGTYVAREAIFINGARAFNAGDPVPVSHVERKVVHPDQVEKKG